MADAKRLQLASSGSSAQQSVGLPHGKPFVKGQSGNPSGLPKGMAEVCGLARQHTVLAMSTLVEIASGVDYPPAARAAAASSLLDRGWGRPSQPVGGALDLPPIATKILIELIDGR